MIRWNFLLYFLFRLSSVFLIQTYYVPDEYWQSLEIAHRNVFKLGYVTWEWKHGLRTSIYPLIFTLCYKVLKLAKIDTPELIILIPRILQAILTAISDCYFFTWCKNLNCQPYWLNIAIFTNWFWYYCASRTITNTFETCITTIALCYYPWSLFYSYQNKTNLAKAQSVKYFILAVINCIIRPTAIILWGLLMIFHLFALSQKQAFQLLLSRILPISLLIGLISIIVDSIWYGQFIIPAYQFVKFNLFNGIASFYGTHSVHWYLSQGIPVVLGLHVLPFTAGCLSILFGNSTKIIEDGFRNVFRIIMVTIIVNLIVFSYIPHKEFRFILPITPMMMLVAIKFMSRINIITKSLRIFQSKQIRRKTLKIKQIWIRLLIAGFIIPSALFGLIHQRGTLTLMSHLRAEGSKNLEKSSFLFLMPCHSTPLYSHLHVNVTTRFITCEPPITSNHHDESEEFFKNPKNWLTKHWEEIKEPSHVACFDVLVPELHEFLTSKGYVNDTILWHTIFPQGRIGSNVVVYRNRNFYTFSNSNKK